MSAADLKARVLEAARRDPSPTRDARLVWARRCGQAATVASLLIFLAIGGMHLSRRPEGLIFGSAAGWGAVALGATWLALGRGGSMLGRPRASLLVGAALTPLVLLVVWFLAASQVDVDAAPHGFSVDAFCFGVSLVLGAAPLAAFFVMRPEGEPVDPGAVGAALGAAAGAWGSFLIDLHCERIDTRHVLIGHVLPAAVLAVVGAIVGRRVLAVRPVRRQHVQ